jgi:hypothetical protein
MAFAAAIGPMISGVASLAGAAASASAMNAQADAEEQIAHWNAERQREKANQARGEAAVKAWEAERKGQRTAATARAVAAQSGVSTTRGSPALLDREFAAEIAWESNKATYVGETEYNDWTNKSKVTLYEGKIRADSTRAQARASLLGGVAGAVKGFAGAFG